MADNIHLQCVWSFIDRGPTPRDQEKYTGRRVLRQFTATCVPSSGNVAISDRLECECCTECFGKVKKDLIY